MEKGRPPLEGIKVANFCWYATGPITMRYLAYFGATVVRVESHRSPCALRTMTPYKDGIPGVDRNAWFPNVNSSMRSLSIELSNPSGQEIAKKLIKWADVVGESFSPGRMKKWGLDYESVKKFKPDIIYYSTTQLGQTGPYSAFSGLGYQAAALAGVTYLTGYPEDIPMPFQGAYPDFIAPRFGALTILAALDYRRRTGKGTYIDLSQMECTMHLLSPLIMDYVANQRVAERQGNRLPWAAPHGVYPCKGEDSWCAIGVFSEDEWTAFCNLVQESWTKEPVFATFLDRKSNEDKLDASIATWSAKHEARELEALLQKAGIPAAVVNSVKDLMEEDPQLKARGFFRKYRHSVIGEHIYRGPAFRFSKTPDAQFAGPALGEHTEYVCKELLKLSDDEISDAFANGGITTEGDLPAVVSPF